MSTAAADCRGAALNGMYKLVSHDPGHVALGRGNVAAGGPNEARWGKAASGASGVVGVLLYPPIADTAHPLGCGHGRSHGFQGRHAHDSWFDVGLLLCCSVVDGGAGVILAVAAAASRALRAADGAGGGVRRERYLLLLPGCGRLCKGRNGDKKKGLLKRIRATKVEWEGACEYHKQ